MVVDIQAYTRTPKCQKCKKTAHVILVMGRVEVNMCFKCTAILTTELVKYGVNRRAAQQVIDIEGRL